MLYRGGGNAIEDSIYVEILLQFKNPQHPMQLQRQQSIKLEIVISEELTIGNFNTETSSPSTANSVPSC